MLQLFPVAGELVVVDQIAGAHAAQFAKLLIDGRECSLHGPPFGVLDFLVMVGASDQVVDQPLSNGRLALQPAQELDDLLFEDPDLYGRLTTTRPQHASGAVIVDVAPAMGVDLVLGCDAPAAAATGHEPGIGETVGLGPDAIWSANNLLDPLELAHRDHCIVFAGVGAPSPEDHPGIEGVGQKSVDGSHGEKFAPNSLLLGCAESPVLSGDDCDLPAAVAAGQGKIEHLANQWKPQRIGDNRFAERLVEIAERRLVGSPSQLDLGPVSALHVLGQGVGVVFRLSEHDREHELALRIVLERICREPQVADHPGIEQIDDTPAIDGVAGQPVWRPGDDALGFTALDERQHLAEHRPSRRFGALGLLKGPDDLEVRARAE